MSGGPGKDLTAAMPYVGLLGIELGDIGPNLVEGSLAWAPERCTTGQVMHGGALMGLADTVGGVCAFANLTSQQRTSTLESKTNFLRATRSGRVLARCVPLHVGRTTIVLRTEVRDADDGRLVAFTVQTQAVMPA